MKKELNLESIIKSCYNDMCMWDYMNPVEPNSLDAQYNLGYKSALEDLMNIIEMQKNNNQGL